MGGLLDDLDWQNLVMLLTVEQLIQIIMVMCAWSFSIFPTENMMGNYITQLII